MSLGFRGKRAKVDFCLVRNEKGIVGSNLMSRKTAFTLIELLVVIAIISILMAILLPALSRVRKQAKKVVCQSNVHEWGLLYSMYTNDSDGKFSSGWTWDEGHWIQVLRPYCVDWKGISFCPMARKTMEQGAAVPFAAWEYKMDYVSPGGNSSAIDSVRGTRGSYGINGWCRTKCLNEFHEERVWRTINQPQPHRIPMHMDCFWFQVGPVDTDPPPEYNGDVYEHGTDSVSGGMKRVCIDRHNGVINCVFMDLHVSEVPLKGLWRLKWSRAYNTDIHLPDWPEWMRHMPSP